jgi:hypothetical protein
MRFMLLLVLALAACEAHAPDEPPDEPGIMGACERSFRPTLKAWEAELGRVPEGCAYLDAEYVVQLVSADEMPCEDEPGSIIVGCTVEGDAIYLLDGRLPAQLVDTSVHEWVHVLASCVDGDIDADHLRGELWGTYGYETVEFKAQLSAEIGECL